MGYEGNLSKRSDSAESGGSASNEVSDPWEVEVDRILGEHFRRRLSGQAQDREWQEAMRTQARTTYLLGGRSGKEVNLEHIQTFFNAKLRMAQLEIRRGERGSFKVDLEIFQQAIYLDTRWGRKAAMRWFKDDSRRLQGIRVFYQLKPLLNEEEQNEFICEMGRRIKAAEAAVRFLESVK